MKVVITQSHRLRDKLVHSYLSYPVWSDQIQKKAIQYMKQAHKPQFRLNIEITGR